MTRIRDQVIQYHLAKSLPVGTHPKIPEEARIRLRAKLMSERFIELMRALFPDTYDLEAIETDLLRISKEEPLKPDLAVLVDSCADLDYAVEGTRVEFGVDGGPVAETVHEANMSGDRADVEGLLWEQGWQGPIVY